MKQNFYIFLFFLFSTTPSWGCYEAHLIKIFPIGTKGDTIVSIDFKIRRTHPEVISRYIKIDKNFRTKGIYYAWIIKGYKSKYDKNQNLISSIAIDSSYFIANNYIDTLKAIYTKGFDDLTSEGKIEFFENKYISFCDFQSKCKKISVLYDSITNQNYAVLNNQKISFKIIRDSFSEGVYQYAENASHFEISSIRIFKNNKMELITFHLEMGDFPDYYYNKDEGGLNRKEYEFKLIFDDIKNSTYEEPLVYHGFGLDVFVVKDN
jgi:hypothetical protein